MFESVSPGSRRILSSLGYTALVAVVAGLGYLTFVASSQERLDAEPASDGTETATLPLVEIDGFSPRHEKSSDIDRLSVSVLLRINAPGTLDTWIFVVARNDQASPKLWGAWPAEARDAITAGGHFRGNSPGAGHPLTLTSSWARINASIDHPPGRPPFDTVILYVVNAKGQIVLVRPYPLR